MKQPSLSIVVLCYNEEAVIAKCLDAIAAQSVAPDEVIVVDNNCTDNTIPIVKKYDFVRIVKQPIQGMSPARNAGIAAATCDVVGRIDADSTLRSDWVDVVKKCFADSSVDAATGPVFYNDMPAEKLGASVDKQIRVAITKLSKKSDFRILFGTNMAVRRTSWESIVNEICSDDVVHEDIDIALHMHRAGMNVVFDKAMVVGMSARRLEDSPKEFYKYIMKWQRTFERHPTKSAIARAPIVIWLSVYFPAKMIRVLYDADINQISTKKLVMQAKAFFSEKNQRNT